MCCVGRLACLHRDDYSRRRVSWSPLDQWLAEARECLHQRVESLSVHVSSAGGVLEAVRLDRLGRCGSVQACDIVEKQGQ